MTERLEKIKQRLFEKEYHDPGVWYFKDTNIVTEENKNEPLVIRKGMATRYMGENLPAYIRPDELIEQRGLWHSAADLCDAGRTG